MKFDTAFLRSKVARRIFVLFVLCALLPTGAIAVLSFHHVTRQLNKQSQRRLYQAGKAVGMGIYERMRYLEAEMRAVTYNVSGGLGTNTHALAEGFVERPEERFKGIELVTDAGGHTPLFGHIPNPPEPTRDEMQHIISGKTVLSSQFRLQVPSRMFMMRTVDPENPGAGFFLGEIDTAFLWGIGHMNALPPMTDLIVLDQSNNILISSLPGHVPLPAQVATKMNDSVPRQFEWRHEDKEYLATCWTIFLKAQFSAPNWTVVLSQSKADVLAPMANFKKIFPLVIFLSLWVVLLLSVIHIRRSLVPLERLKEGTQRIAMRDFDSRVRVTSGDEFEELAASFNAMSDQLQRQFNALTTIGEIDRAILSSLDIENIVDTVLTRMQDVFTCDAVCMSLTDSNKSNTARAYVGNGNPGNEKRVEVIELKPAEVQKLHDNPQRLFIHVDKEPPHYLEPLVKDGIKSFLVLPIFLEERLSGIITLGYLHSPEVSEEDLVQARQLADQVAVALSNIHLITEQKRLETQLIHSQKMQSIGTLAGGIAHDFNNILFPIMCLTEMTMDDVPEDSLARSNLAEVLKAANRAKDLVQQILTFSRQGEQERKLLRIQPIIKEVLKFLRGSLPSTIEINQNMDNECGAILSDPTQIHQVMMNLCTNAYHAMREKGGVLRVILTEVNIDSSDSGPNLDLNPGPYVRLSVSDTGHGMDRAVMERIFDPFFTTKDPGEGTGMGLSVVHGIIRSHGGNITVDSAPGEGATFHIYLPQIDTTAIAPETVSTGPLPRGKERILLVDDEEQVVNMVRQMLERLGYHVTARTSSVEALEAFRAQPEKFDLVITDQTMPNMTGAELTKKLIAIRPDIPAILCTGFSEVISEEKAREIGISEYVMKPVVMSDIAKTIRRLLDQDKEN